MALSRGDHTLVAFEHPDTAARDPEAELKEFREPQRRMLLRWLIKVRNREADYRVLKVYTTYGGVPLFRAQADGLIAIFAVEDSGEEDVKVSLLFAGFRHPLPGHTRQIWNGSNEDELLSLVLDRCQLHFRPF